VTLSGRLVVLTAEIAPRSAAKRPPAEEISNLQPSRHSSKFDEHNLWPFNHLQAAKTTMASVY
jgi:hypothetical protein